MTNKTTMPDPMVEVDKHTTAPELQYTYLAPAEGLEHGDQLITTTQAEAYADARVREALGPVTDELERICAADRAGDCESIAMDALSYIRALFPQ